MLALCTQKDATAAIFVGNKDHVEHMQKIRGFSDSLEKHALRLIGVYETYDDETIALQLFDKISESHTGLDGLYVATSTFVAIGERLKEKHPDLKVICTDVDSAVATCLASGVVQASLFQDLERQGRTAVRILYEYIAEQKTPAKTVYITPQLVIKSNLDIFL